MVLIIHSIKILETIPHQVSRGQTITNQKRWLLKTLSCMIQISVYQKPQKVIQTNHCQISKVQIVAKTMGKDSNIISDFNSCAVFCQIMPTGLKGQKGVQPKFACQRKMTSRKSVYFFMEFRPEVDRKRSNFEKLVIQFHGRSNFEDRPLCVVFQNDRPFSENFI